jgi:cytidylate kinase
MATAIVLYGPKAVGKSWVAEVLRTHLGVAHWVRRRVVDALARHALVSVEATGAWDSDWRLADDLEAAGARVLRVWVSAPREVAMGRLAGRTSRRVPVSAEEASWIYHQATARAAGRRLDAWIDTGRPPDPAAVVAELWPLIQP